MLHLAIIGLVCAVSAPNEGIALNGHKNNELNPFCLSDEIKPNISAVTSFRVYNVDVNDSSDCDNKKITNRTSSFFYDYIIKQYQNNKNSFSSDANNIPLEKQKNFQSKINSPSFRKRNLLWMHTKPKSRSSIKKEKCQKRNCKKKKCHPRRPKKKKAKCKPSMNLCTLNHEEKDLFLKLKNLKNSHPGHIYFFEMNNLDLDQRLEKFSKKINLKKQLRDEKLCKISEAEAENNNQILKGSSKNSKHHTSVMRIIKNFFSSKKKSNKHPKYYADDKSALFTVNNVRRKNPVYQKTGSVSIFDIPQIVPETQSGSAVKSAMISYSDNCDLESSRKKNLIAKPHLHSANFDTKMNSLQHNNRKFSLRNRKKRYQKVISPLSKLQREYKKQPFLDKVVRRNLGANAERENWYEKMTPLKKFFNVDVLPNKKIFFNPRESLTNGDKIWVKINKRVNLFSSKFGGKKKTITEGKSVLIPTVICEEDCLPDHSIEKPFLKHVFRNKMESYESNYETMTDSPILNPTRHKRHTRQAPDSMVLPFSPHSRIRHTLRKFRRSNHLHRPMKQRLLIRSCGEKICSTPRKCWRSAPLLCIPYIKKGQEDILRYLIQVMERMLGKPFPPKKDIFGHTKYKPSQEIFGQNCYDDSCENDYVTDNIGILSCCNVSQPTPAPYTDSSIQMRSSTFAPSMKVVPGTFKTPVTPIKNTPATDFANFAFNNNSYFQNPQIGPPVLNEFQNPGLSPNQIPNPPLLFDSVITPPPAPKNLVSPSDKTATLKSNDSENNNASSVSYTTTSAVTESPTSTVARDAPYASTMSPWPMRFPQSPAKLENAFPMSPFSYNLLPKFSEDQHNLNTSVPVGSESLAVPNPGDRKSQFIGRDVNLDNFGKFWSNTQELQQRLSATAPATLPPSKDISKIMNWYQPQAVNTQNNLQMQDDFTKNSIFKPDYLKSSENSVKKYLNKKNELPYGNILFDDNIVPDLKKNIRAYKRKLRKMHHKKYLNYPPIDPVIPFDYYSYKKRPLGRPYKVHKRNFRKNLKKNKKNHRRDKYRKLKDFDYPLSLLRRKREDDYVWPEIYSDYLDESDYINENMKNPPEGASRVSDRNTTVVGKNSSVPANNSSDYGWTPAFFDMFSELARVVSELMTPEPELGNTTSFGSTNNTPSIMINSNITTPAIFRNSATITTASTSKTTSSTTDTTVSTSNTTPGTTADSDINNNIRTTRDADAGAAKSSISFTDGSTPNTISATTITTTTALTKSAVVAADAPRTKVATATATVATTKITVTEISKSHKTENQTTIFQDEETKPRTETTIFDEDALTMPITEQKNLSSAQNTNSSHSLGASVKAIIKKTAHKFNSSIGGKLGGSKMLDTPKPGKVTLFQTGPKTNLSSTDFYTEKSSKKNSGKEDKESDIVEGHIPTTLKSAFLAKGPKKLLTKPSPKVYSKVYPDPFDSDFKGYEVEGITSTAATTPELILENKAALVSATLKPDIQLQLLAVCEGYLDIIKRIKLINETFGEDLDAQLAGYCENIISQNFNTQLEKPKKAELNGIPVQFNNVKETEKPEINPTKQNEYSGPDRAVETDEEFFESEFQNKIVDEPTNHLVFENDNENEDSEYKELEIINEENNSTESKSTEKEKPKKKKRRRKKKKKSTDTSLEEETDETNGKAEEEILKRETTQVKLIDLLKKRKKELVSWLVNFKNQFKANVETETEYFDDEDFIPPDYDFSDTSGTIKPKREGHVFETTSKSLYGTNDSVYPVYAQHYGYDKEGEVREVEILWRKVNEKTHEEKILKNISVIAFLTASTDSSENSQEEVKLLNGKEYEGEDMPETELKAGNKVGYANELVDSHSKTSSPKAENTTLEDDATAASVITTTEKTKTTNATMSHKKNATHRFISKPDPSSIVGTLPNKTKALKNITRKATHKYAVAKDIFQEYSIEFLNYAVYILPAMFTIIFLFCCFGCALYILKSRKFFKKHKKKKRRRVSTDETSETTDSDDSSSKRKRDAKRKKKHKDDEDDENLEKKNKKKFWDVLKMHSKSPYRDLNDENGQNERKNILRFLKGRKDESKNEGKTNYRDSGDENHYSHFAGGSKKEKQKDDSNNEAIERRELISLLEELKKIELEQTGEKKEVKSVHVQYAIQEDDNPFRRHPEIYYPYEKNVFGLPKGYFPCSKKFPGQKTDIPSVKNFEVSDDVSETAELLPCECHYYSKKNDYLKPDFGVNPDQCKHSYKMFRDFNVKSFRHKNPVRNDFENRNLGYSKYKSANTDTSEELVGLNTKNTGTEVRIPYDGSPLRFSKKNPGLVEEMKHQIYKEKYVRLKDDGVLCRL